MLPITSLRYYRAESKLKTTVLFLVLLVLSACGGGGGGNKKNNPPPADNPPTFNRIALSVSPFSEIIFDASLTMTDGQLNANSIDSLSNFYMTYGGNEIFARLSTERTTSAIGEDRSLAQAVNRANHANSLGLPLNPELGLFGSYGDASCQTMPDFSEYPEITLPGPWETLTVDQMLPALRTYGQLVAQEIVNTGVTVNIWDIGNEIGFGTAGVAPQPLVNSHCDTTEGTTDWYRAPDGVDPVIGTESVLSLLQMSEQDRITWLQTHVWPHEARILAAVAEGIRNVVPEAKFSTHITYGQGQDFAVAFFTAMRDGGFDVDEAGFSFYPSSGTISSNSLDYFKDVVLAIRQSLNKPVFIAEYAYPAKQMTNGPYAHWNFTVPGYPLSETGQADLLYDLVAWSKDNGVTGIRPWAPDVFVGHWEPMALFTPINAITAQARPGLSAIGNALAE